MSKCVPVCHFHPARESAGIPHCFTGVVLLLYDLIAWHFWSLGQLVGSTNINHPKVKEVSLVVWHRVSILYEKVYDMMS